MIISRTGRAFEGRWKAFFLILQVLSFRHTKQSSKNVADTTFNIYFVKENGLKDVIVTHIWFGTMFEYHVFWGFLNLHSLAVNYIWSLENTVKFLLKTNLE